MSADELDLVAVALTGPQTGGYERGLAQQTDPSGHPGVGIERDEQLRREVDGRASAAIDTDRGNECARRRIEGQTLGETDLHAVEHDRAYDLDGAGRRVEGRESRVGRVRDDAVEPTPLRMPVEPAPALEASVGDLAFATRQRVVFEQKARRRHAHQAETRKRALDAGREVLHDDDGFVATGRALGIRHTDFGG